MKAAILAGSLIKRSRITKLQITITLGIAALVSAGSVVAAPRLPGFFTDNMVFQRNVPVPIWGWADPGETVTVKYDSQVVSTTADSNGEWQVRLAPMEASERGKPLFVGPNVKLSNIVVGDVWLCAGPSNMEMRLGHVQNAENEIAGANFPLIRQIELPTISVNLPQPTIVGSWLPSSPSTAAGFTAVGYFFARTLYLDQHVPIGLINACYIATKIERWIAPEGFRMVPSLSQIADSVDATLPTRLRWMRWPSGSGSLKRRSVIIASHPSHHNSRQQLPPCRRFRPRSTTE